MELGRGSMWSRRVRKSDTWAIYFEFRKFGEKKIFNLKDFSHDAIWTARSWTVWSGSLTNCIFGLIGTVDLKMNWSGPLNLFIGWANPNPYRLLTSLICFLFLSVSFSPRSLVSGSAPTPISDPNNPMPRFSFLPHPNSTISSANLISARLREKKNQRLPLAAAVEWVLRVKRAKREKAREKQWPELGRGSRVGVQRELES